MIKLPKKFNKITKKVSGAVSVNQRPPKQMLYENFQSFLNIYSMAFLSTRKKLAQSITIEEILNT